jgi:hypothetical protein
MAENLLTDLTKLPKAHRGLDLASHGNEFPTEVSVGQVHYTGGDVFVYNGDSWESALGGRITGVATTYTPTTTTSTVSIAPSPVVSWAGPLLPHDNDMLYVRRKEGKLYYLIANDYGGGSKWVEIAGSSTLPVGKAAGKESREAEVTVEIIEDELPDFDYGWYQDPSANLYQYDSDGWVGVATTLAKKLNKMTEDGKMEYLG